VSELTPEQDGKLFSFIAASRRGNFIPVQLFFNNVRIPVNVVNHSEGNKYGLCLSKHQKLAEMAEKGRQFLQMLVDAAVKRGASETDLIHHKPTEVISLTTPLESPPPQPPPVVQAPPVQKEPVLAPPKKAGLPDNLKDLPPKHPLIDLVKMRYDSFNRKAFLLRSLGPHAAPYYINNYVKRDSEMVKVLGDNAVLQKKTVYRWVTNELNLLVGGIDKRPAVVIENHFKQAIYAYMKQRKQNDIIFDDIVDLLEGKLKEQFRPVRETFLASVCQLIEGEVQKRFAEYHSDSNEDNLKAQALKDEEQRMQNMHPQELVKNYLWPKIVEYGELAKIHKETAKSWVPKENAMKIAEMGHVVVFTQHTLDLFVDTIKESVAPGENLRSYFDVVDLKLIYEKGVESKGEKVRDTFGLYVDNLQPAFKRDILLSKVINSPAWSRYYVLKKSKAYFSKAPSAKATAINTFIEENMMTSSAEGKFI